MNLPLAADGVASTTPITASPPSVDFGTRLDRGRAFEPRRSPSRTPEGRRSRSPASTIRSARSRSSNPPATNGERDDPAERLDRYRRSVHAAVHSGAFTQTFNGQLRLETDGGDGTRPVAGFGRAGGADHDQPDYDRLRLRRDRSHRHAELHRGERGRDTADDPQVEAPVANQFKATTTLAEATVIPPHQHVTETVRFTPTARGVRTGSLDDQRQRRHRGAERPLHRHRRALRDHSAALRQMDTERLGDADRRGRSSSRRPNSSKPARVLAARRFVEGVNVSFVATIGGGGGADGLTLAFADAATAHPTALGGVGNGLGFGGIPGVAVGLATLSQRDEHIGELDRPRQRNRAVPACTGS